MQPLSFRQHMGSQDDAGRHMKGKEDASLEERKGAPAKRGAQPVHKLIERIESASRSQERKQYGSRSNSVSGKQNLMYQSFQKDSSKTNLLANATKNPGRNTNKEKSSTMNCHSAHRHDANNS